MSTPREGVCTSWFKELHVGKVSSGSGSGSGSNALTASVEGSGTGSGGGSGGGSGDGSEVVPESALLTEPIKAQIWVKKGTFKLPASASTPLIVVGPGTGCAPFRSILQQRVLEGATENVLFFGNRNREGDYLYKDDWDAMASKGGTNATATATATANSGTTYGRCFHI